MKRLWAGWRMPYIQAGAGGGKCLFCRLARLSPAPENLVLERGEHALIVLNAFPYNCGHLMVAPIRHRSHLAPLNPEEAAAVWEGLTRCERALRRAYKPQGLNVGVNLGRAAGAGVVGHVHFHVVPRWGGDTNFMPAVAGTRVLPESLDVTYGRLREALRGGPGGKRGGRKP